jgi:hypothetical protein
MHCELTSVYIKQAFPPNFIDTGEIAPILFADDASVLISHANPLQFKNTINVVYGILNDWFVNNPLSLNKVKTRCINFTAKTIC